MLFCYSRPALFALITLSWFISCVKSSNFGKCLQPNLNVSYFPASNPCQGIVDYSYFLPEGETMSSMSLKAVSAFTNPNLRFLTPECKRLFVLDVCSSLFLKCLPNNRTSLEMYQEVNASLVVPLPVMRPCQSNCDKLEEKCGSIMTLFGMAPNCTARSDILMNATGVFYNHPFKYDAENNASTCNAWNRSLSFADSHETYLYPQAGVCAGIVHSIYVPLGSGIGTAYAPLQESQTYQRKTEDKLRSSINKLPVWLEKQCRFALRVYLCTTSFFRAEMKLLRQELSLFNHSQFGLPMVPNVTFAVPSYPERKICESYASHCAAILKKNPPKCSTAKSGRFLLFPTEDQIVANISVKLVAQQFQENYPVSSEPAQYVLQDTTGYEAACPPGFVNPDHPDDPDAFLIPGSGCAFGCRWNFYTDEEYAYMTLVARNCAILGLGLVLILLILLLWSREKNLQRLPVVVFGASCCVIAVFTLLSTTPTIPFETKFCRDNAIGYTSHDHFTYCAVQAVVFEYCVLVCVLAWLWQCFLFVDNAFFAHMILCRYWKQQIAFVVIVPIIAPIYRLANGTYQFSPVGFQCSYSTSAVKRYDDMNTFHFPVYFALGLGILFILVSSVKCSCCGDGRLDDERTTFRRIDNQDNNSSGRNSMVSFSFSFQRTSNHQESAADGANTNQNPAPAELPDQVPETGVLTRSPSGAYVVAEKYFDCFSTFGFVFFFLLFFASLTVFRRKLKGSTKPSPIAVSWSEWIVCLFANYKPDDDAWVELCGLEPAIRPTPSSLAYVAFAQAGFAVLLGVLFLPEIMLLLSRRIKQWTAGRKSAVVHCAPSTDMVPSGEERMKNSANLESGVEMTTVAASHIGTGGDGTARMHFGGSNGELPSVSSAQGGGGGSGASSSGDIRGVRAAPSAGNTSSQRGIAHGQVGWMVADNGGIGDVTSMSAAPAAGSPRLQEGVHLYNNRVGANGSGGEVYNERGRGTNYISLGEDDNTVTA